MKANGLITRLVARGSSGAQMATLMKGNGRMTKPMDLGHSSRTTERRDMLGIGETTCTTDRVSKAGQTDQGLMVTSHKEKRTALELIFGQMAHTTLATGPTTR